MSISREPRWLLAGLTCVSVLWFALLGNRSLYDPDEGRYAEIPREMLETGDYVIPHLDGLAYLEKPPLQYWLTALGFRAFGASDWSARLVPGIAGYLSLAAIYYVGRRLWGVGAGLRAALLTGSSTLFVLLAHQLTLDMLLCFFLVVSLAGFLAAQLQREQPARCRNRMLVCWAAMALAVLTKGLIGVVIPAASLLLYLLWQRDWRARRSLHIGWGLPLLVAIAAPWVVLAARANPDFLQFFFVREHVLRFFTPIEDRSEAWWFFFPVLALGILPWMPLAVRALADTCRSGEPYGRFDPGRLLCSWSVFTFVFFSFSDSKLVTYVLPAIPPLALLCARPSASEVSSIRQGALLSIAASLGILVYASGEWNSPQADMLARQMLCGLDLTAALLAAAAIVTLALLSRAEARWALLALCAGSYLGTAGLLIAGSEVQGSFSGHAAAELLKSVAPAGAPVYAVQYYEQTLPFYLKRFLVLVDYRDEFALGLDESPGAGIADLAEFALRWRESREGYAIMRLHTLDLLKAQGLPLREIGRVRNRVVISRH